MWKVRSFPNMIDELTALTRHQREYRQCSIVVFTEAGLKAVIIDATVTADGFALIRADRTTMGDWQCL